MVEFTPEGGMDLDLGSASRDPMKTGDTARLDFSLDDPSRGNDRWAARPRPASWSSRNSASRATQRMTAPEGQDGPTVEQPQIDDGGTLRTKLDAQSQFIVQRTRLPNWRWMTWVSTSAGSIRRARHLLDDSRLTRELASQDAPTLVAGLDETSRRMIADAQEGQHPTELLPLGEATGRGRDLEGAVLDYELDFDSRRHRQVTRRWATRDFKLDLDVGAPTKPGDARACADAAPEPRR